MKRRNFIVALLALPLFGCAIPVVGNSPEELKQRKRLKEESFKINDKVLVIMPLQKGRNFDFGPGYLHSLHPISTSTFHLWCVRFERETRLPIFAYYQEDELVRI